MENIVRDLLTLAEDKGKQILTDDVIRDYVEQSIDLLVEEIKEELKKY